MSPRNSTYDRNMGGGRRSARDAIISRLTPAIMRAYEVSRPMAYEMLAACTEEERAFLWRLAASARGKKTAKVT